MEILFCDLCNESIPASHLEVGKAFRRGGRLTCAACDLAMGGGGAPEAERSKRAADRQPPGARALPPAGSASAEPAPAAPVAGGSGAAGIGVGLLALLVAGTGLGLFMERLEQTEGQMETLALELSSQQRKGAAEMRAQGTRMEDRLAELGAGLEQRVTALGAGLETRLERLAQQDDEQSAGLAELRTDLKRISGELDASAAGRVDQLNALAKQIEALEGDQRFYSDRLAELDEQLRAVETMRPGSFGAGPSLADASAPGGAPAGPAPWEGLLPDLGHQHPGIRMEAVYELAETGDSRVIPHVIPMLRDEDLFVRMATTRALMDLEAKQGVPGLIDTLEDGSGAVREAAMVALRRITNREFGFLPLASVSQRSARVKAWRDWWEKDGEAFLAS